MINIDFGLFHDYTTQLMQIKDWTLKLRQLRPQIKTTWKKPADWVIKDANIYGKPVKSLTITLTPSGCEWASTGGCTMCGEFEGSTKGNIVSSEFHIAQFASAISKFVSDHKPAWLRIYQEGNYANQHEMKDTTQHIILRLASIIGGIQRITIESKAMYLSQEHIEILKRAISPDVELELGIGFESANDVVRNICVNKGETIDSYRKAVRLLKEMGIRSLAYVALKPPFLSEDEAITDAITTVQSAHDIGFDAISLEPISIHGYTLVHALNTEGFYQVPWLWSVLKVAQNARYIKDFRIGGVGYYPRPVNVAYNRHLDETDGCNEVIWKAIIEYGKYRNMDIFDRLKCSCKEKWMEACNIPIDSLCTRIDQQLKCLDINRYTQFICKTPLTQQPVVSYTSADTGDTQYPGNVSNR